MSTADKPRPKRFGLQLGGHRLGLPQMAIALGCLAGLAALLAAEHNELSRALSAVGHSKPGLVFAAVGSEWLSLIALYSDNDFDVLARHTPLSIEPP
jgi:hypothetical protein